MSSLPRKMNLGCGQRFLDDYFNVDIRGEVEPDLIWDFSRPFPPKYRIPTKRFGFLRIETDWFDEIVCMHVLEHIPDLLTAMRSCRQVLRPGGELRITVPYDLSYGAWQDPTHLRAFNEKSWRYFTDWCEWPEGGFELAANSFKLSPYGAELQQKGMPDDDILRLPRAVNEMVVILRRPLG